MDKSKLWAVVAFVLGLIGSGTGLMIAGRDIESILYLYTGLAGIAATTIPILFQVSKLNQKQDAQTDKLQEIQENTNGILSKKIAVGVESVLRKHGLIDSGGGNTP